MPIKYYCPNCDRRFVDWGAEKIGYLCPSCEGQKLLKVGATESESAPPPSLKRKPAKVARRSGGKTSTPADDLLEAGTTVHSSGVRPDVIGLPDGDSDESGASDDDELAADGGTRSALNVAPGFESVDQDE